MVKKLFSHGLFSFLLVILSSTVIAADDNSEINGAEVINNNCSRCHNARSIDEFSLEEWSVVIPHMRVRAHLTGEEARAVLKLFQDITLSTSNGFSVGVVGDVRPGEELMTAYVCLGCHSFGGSGGTVAPALDNIISSLGEDFFREKLRDPQFNNIATPMPKLNIPDREIEVLIEYLKE